MKILFVTNLPSPYRVDFFNEFGKLCDLTVIYERKTASDRDKNWKGDKALFYEESYIKPILIGTDKSVGLGVVKEIKKRSFDFLIITGYASPSIMAAITYCRLRKIPYYTESDGGFFKKDRFPKSVLKKFLLSNAKGHFITCDEYKKYLFSLGISEERIYKYPFSSLKNADIISEPIPMEEKSKIKETLGIKETKVVLAVGQFIKRKGFDVLIKAAKYLSTDIGVYFVGGTPTEEYISLRESLKLKNVHFIGFKTRDELKKYYKAADLFVLPTKEDVWGLVINEAMAYGLPVVTTDRCIAGLELIKNGKNGYTVPTDNPSMLTEKVNLILNDSELSANMSLNAISAIRQYTVENMAGYHYKALKNMLEGSTQ